MTEELKAISIRQPWAHLILAGIPLVKQYQDEDGKTQVRTTGQVVMKDVENRTWYTKFRGVVMIHASLRDDRLAYRWLMGQGFSPLVCMALAGPEIPRGAILGQVEIYDVVKDSTSPFALPEHWHWLLRNPVMYSVATPCAGKLGFWTPRIEIAK